MTRHPKTSGPIAAGEHNNQNSPAARPARTRVELEIKENPKWH